MSVPRACELPSLKISSTKTPQIRETDTSLGNTSRQGTSRVNNPKCRLHLPTNEPYIMVKDKAIVYLEEGANKCSKYKIDFGTPRTQEAAAKVGITFKDCIKKPKSDFFTQETDEKIAKLAYERHCTRVQDNIKEVFAVRKEIVKWEKRKDQEEIGYTKATVIRGVTPFKQQLTDGKVSPGHFPNPIKELFMPQNEASVDPKEILGHAERKEMVDYIQKAWKELKMIMEDQRRDAMIKQKRAKSTISRQSSPNRSPSPRSTTQGIKNVTSTNPIRNSHANSIKLDALAEAQKTEDARSLYSENCSSVNQKMSRTDGFDLNSQILNRIRSRKLTLKKMAERESIQLEKIRLKDHEWEQKQSYLKSILDKWERVNQNVELENTGKVLKAARSSSNSQGIREKAGTLKTERDYKVIASYMKKAEKIEECKRKREEKIQETLEKRKKMLIEKKQKQEAVYEKQRAEGIKALKEYAEQLQNREEKTRMLVQKVGLEGRQHWRNLVEFNKSLQRENQERLEKRKTLKRNLVWNTHKNLKEKNDKKNTQYQTQQCMVRAQSIYNRKGKEHTYQFINLLRKTDPNKSEQRQKLVGALELISNKLGCGLKFRLPSPDT